MVGGCSDPIKRSISHSEKIVEIPTPGSTLVECLCEDQIYKLCFVVVKQLLMDPEGNEGLVVVSYYTKVYYSSMEYANYTILHTYYTSIW